MILDFAKKLKWGLWTKLFNLFFGARCRLVRFPFFIRGIKWIHLGTGFTSGVGCRIEAYKTNAREPEIHFGEKVSIGDYVHIACVEKVHIGNNVLMASKIYISDHNHGSYKGDLQTSPLTSPINRNLNSAPVMIEDDVWIGEFVSIMPGVTVGKGAIIGTMSVVTKSIPPFSIAVGSPAGVIKKYCFEENRWKKIKN